jgi:hypothetical protein
MKKKAPSAAAMKQRAKRKPATRRKPTKADKWASTALYGLLHEVCVITSLLSVTSRSLEKQQVGGDERDAVELTLKMLRQVDSKLNVIADKVDDGEPVSRKELLRAGAFDDEDDMEGGA